MANYATIPFSQVRGRLQGSEGPTSLGGYNALAYNTPNGRNAAGVVAPMPISDMTMGELYDWQRSAMREKTRGHRGPNDIGSTGVGAYQFESQTMRDNAQRAFGDNWRNQKFSPEVQDQLAEHLYNSVRGDPNRLAATWNVFGNQNKREADDMATVLPMTRGAYGGGPVEIIGGREGNFKVQDPNSISPEAVNAAGNINRMQDFKRQMLPLALGSMMSEDRGSQVFGANTFREAMEGVEPYKMQNGVLTDEGQYVTDQDQSGLLKMALAQANRDRTAEQAQNQQAVQGEDRLADDYRKNAKVYESVLNDYKKLKAATPDAIGDISMVYNYMKILDPASTVREGEAATVEQARGVPSTVLNMYNKLFEGVRLNDEQRKQILNTGLGYAENAATSLRGEHDYLKDVAKRRGYNFDNIVPYSHSKSIDMIDQDIAARKKPQVAQPTGQVGGLSNPEGGRKGRAGVQSGVPTGVPEGALPHPSGGYYTVVDGQVVKYPAQ